MIGELAISHMESKKGRKQIVLKINVGWSGI